MQSRSRGVETPGVGRVDCGAGNQRERSHQWLVNSKVTRTGTEPLFKVKSFFYPTMVMNYDTYLEIDQDSDSEFPF